MFVRQRVRMRVPRLAVHQAPRTTTFFKMGIGCHGFGVLDKAVSYVNSHGLPEDGCVLSQGILVDLGMVGEIPRGV